MSDSPPIETFIHINIIFIIFSYISQPSKLFPNYYEIHPISHILIYNLGHGTFSRYCGAVAINKRMSMTIWVFSSVSKGEKTLKHSSVSHVSRPINIILGKCFLLHHKCSFNSVITLKKTQFIFTGFHQCLLPQI